MRTLSFIIILLINLSICLNAQDTIRKVKIYRTWVSKMDKTTKTKGVLYEVKDSSILVTNSLIPEDYLSNNFYTINIHIIEAIELHINNIETIKVRRKNSVGKGILIGLFSGFAAGALMGIVDGDDPYSRSSSGVFMGDLFQFTAEEKIILLGTPLAIIGAGIGAWIGSAKVIIPINGNIKVYKRNRKKLKKYSVKYYLE
jgi:hypothetical protein